MLKTLILRASDAADGNGNQPSQPATKPAAISTPAPPEAATVVATGKKTEREIQLEGENSKLKAAIQKTAANKRKVEIQAAHLQDENFQLKNAGLKPQPVNQPAKEKFSWMGYRQD